MTNCLLRKTEEKGEGLYAGKDFKKGDVIYICQIQMDDCPNDAHACQSEMNKWVMFTKMGRSMNHSCDPNCWLGFDGTNWFYGAYKDIKEGTELNFDYAMSNYIVDNIPECLCGTPQCRKVIKGYRNLPLQKKLEYKSYYAPYLEKFHQQQMRAQ